MDYETIKRYSPREVELLVEAMNELRKEQEKAIKSAQSGKGGGDSLNIQGGPGRIGIGLG